MLTKLSAPNVSVGTLDSCLWPWTFASQLSGLELSTGGKIVVSGFGEEDTPSFKEQSPRGSHLCFQCVLVKCVGCIWVWEQHVYCVSAPCVFYYLCGCWWWFNGGACDGKGLTAPRWWPPWVGGGSEGAKARLSAMGVCVPLVVVCVWWVFMCVCGHLICIHGLKYFLACPPGTPLAVVTNSSHSVSWKGSAIIFRNLNGLSHLQFCNPLLSLNIPGKKTSRHHAVWS